MHTLRTSDLPDPYAKAAEELAKAVPNRALAYYAVADDGWLEHTIYADGPRSIEWVENPLDLFDLVYDAWEADPPEKRWTALELQVRDGHFRATFKFADDFAPEVDPCDMREDFARRAFGDKPIDYGD